MGKRSGGRVFVKYLPIKGILRLTSTPQKKRPATGHWHDAMTAALHATLQYSTHWEQHPPKRTKSAPPPPVGPNGNLPSDSISKSHFQIYAFIHCSLSFFFMWKSWGSIYRTSQICAVCELFMSHIHCLCSFRDSSSSE